jgi:hypothetical protein
MDDQAIHPKSVRTSQGQIHLEQPDQALVRSLHGHLPMGLRKFAEPHQGASYGIVVKQGEQEMRFLKQQPPEVSEANVGVMLHVNALLIGVTLAQYLAHGRDGWFWPSAYVRKKSSGMEIGIAYAGGGSMDAGEDEGISSAFDDSLGDGFTCRMVEFVESIKAQSQITGISLQPTIGLDVRARSQLGSLAFGFLILDQTVICLKTSIREDDPVWTVIRASGIDTVVHLPAVPLELPAVA